MSAVDFSKLIRIAAAADVLENYLGKHTGDNADWPIEILADNTEDAERLCSLLCELKAALASYRECKRPLDKTGADSESGGA